MVSVIAFLTFTNIALGYGLAVYIHRHYGTLLLTRKRSPQPAASPMIGTEEVVDSADDMPTAVDPAPVLETSTAHVEPIAAVSEAPPADTVDEENVLAGIEEFRSQLAKMSDPQAAAVEKPESELVGAAN